MLLLLITLFAIPNPSKKTENDSKEAFAPSPFNAPWESCGPSCKALKAAGIFGALTGVAYAATQPKQAMNLFTSAPEFLKKQALKAVNAVSYAGSSIASLGKKVPQ
eukprot:NODE_504_length_7539_cov_0.176613.p5 type:complete len:106 gc:universal NODE_504_length_7539_cov_0.176613:4974-5291(+)